MEDNDMRDVIQRHAQMLLRRTGVTGLAQGNAREHGGADAPCLVLFVTEDADTEDLPDQLEGNPVYLVRMAPFLPH
ncbi:hypothetical protein [Pyxidicoccus trucidator]|jgi:hypothetical protein|uniref:hypothetical protein n=1 Tax=Pyxidicoccus trucidator TaxID=2709662 RepID=UPI0013DBCBD3|nr:hypothetical protein [Pyxidicoccus trucidator]